MTYRPHKYTDLYEFLKSPLFNYKQDYVSIESKTTYNKDIKETVW